MEDHLPESRVPVPPAANRSEEDGDISSADDDFDIKNCRKCGMSPDEAEGTMKNCSRCKSVSYCSKECQVRDWKRHKKACAFMAHDRKQMQKIVAALNAALNNPVIMSRLERLHAAGIVDMRGARAGISEAQYIQINGLNSALQGPEELRRVLERYRGVDTDKLARKLLKQIRDTPERTGLCSEIYSYMYENNSAVWDACFVDDDMKGRFFEALLSVMQADIQYLDALQEGMHFSIKPASCYAITRCCFREQPEFRGINDGRSNSGDGTIVLLYMLEAACDAFIVHVVCHPKGNKCAKGAFPPPEALVGRIYFIRRPRCDSCRLCSSA